ncbi:MAG: hypothetical protein Aureis2KO_29350 [Aureisphaera sp.]
MKNAVLILCLLAAFGQTLAQGHPQRKGQERGERLEMMKDLSPEQRAELKTKRMTLDLDLSSTQQQQVKALLVQEEKNRPSSEEMKERREKRKELTSEEFYQKSIERLDSQIAMKAKFKEILSEEQYEKFEKSNKRKSHARKRQHKRQGRR